MVIEMRFYCQTCNKAMDRRFVVPKNYEDGYRCKWCGGRVFNMKKILADVAKSWLEYCDEKGIDIDVYE